MSLLAGSTVGDYLVHSDENHYQLDHHTDVILTSILRMVLNKYSKNLAYESQL